MTTQKFQINAKVSKTENTSFKKFSHALSMKEDETITFNGGYCFYNVATQIITQVEFGVVIDFDPIKDRHRIKWDRKGVRTWIKTERLTEVK